MLSVDIDEVNGIAILEPDGLDLNLRVVYSDDPEKYHDEDYEEPMSLVDEQG